MSVTRVFAFVTSTLLIVVAFSGGCSDQICTPGTSQACAGESGCRGVQTCAADGTTWGLCDCGQGLDGNGNDASTPDASNPAN